MLGSWHMTQSISVLSKRTKQDILNEYEKLQDQLEDIRSTAQTVHSQPAMELLEKTKAKTPQSVEKLFSDFQASLHGHLMEMRVAFLEQTGSLQEIQKAIDLSRQQLELQRHIVVAADALDLLVEDHTKRSATFEAESETRKQALDELIAAKKKTWEREAEEYEYHKKLRQERDQVETEEREKAFLVRESAIRTQEQEMIQMKKTIEQAPKELQQAIEKCEQDTTARLMQQFSHEKTLLEKETGAQAGLLQLTVKNLEDRLASMGQEIESLKQQAQEANTKAQTLAIKAIERPTTIVAPGNPAPNNQSSFHDRGQGRANG
mgnify:CR=1 FL=1